MKLARRSAARGGSKGLVHF